MRRAHEREPVTTAETVKGHQLLRSLDRYKFDGKESLGMQPFSEETEDPHLPPRGTPKEYRSLIRDGVPLPSSIN